jgi:uncharacterized protein (DUF697 family)
VENLGQLLLGAFILLCVLPLVVGAVCGFFLFRFAQSQLQSLKTDAEELNKQYTELVAANPKADRDELVRKIISRQAWRSGLVGLLTGVWGAFALPITLPIDLFLSVQIQAEMVAFIARIYGFADTTDTKMASYLVMSGSSRVTQMTASATTGFLLRIIGKSFSKFIPVIGAFASFAVNYALTQATGRAAVRWYTGRDKRKLDAVPNAPA